MNAVESKLLNDPNEEYSKKLVSIEADAKEVLSIFFPTYILLKIFVHKYVVLLYFSQG